MAKLDAKQTRWVEPTLFDGGHSVVSISIEMIFDGGQGRAHGLIAIRSVNERPELLAMSGQEIAGSPTSPAVLQYVRDALASVEALLLPF